MSKPLVTVITPTYNCGKFIQDTVDSVLGQDYGNVHYLVLDDGSTDNTRKILKQYDNRIIYLRHQNQGEQKTVNDGLRRVMGKYFFILNGDDRLLPGSIAKLVDFMEAHPDILCAYPDWDMINEDGSLRREVKCRDYDFGYLVRHHTWMMGVGTIFRSEVIKLIGYWDESFKYVADADYWLRIGLVGPMAHIPESLAFWRYRSGQLSKEKNSQRSREHVRLMQKFFNTPCINGYKHYQPEAMCWANLVASVVAGSKKDSLGYITKAVKGYPQIVVSPDFWGTAIDRAKYYLGGKS